MQTPEAQIIIGSLAARLARSPAAEWRIDEDEAALILDALLDQIDLNSNRAQLKNASDQYLNFRRKAERLNRLNSWTAVFISALFAALFMVGQMIPHALIAGTWAIIAALWARRINSEKDTKGERP